MIAYNALRRRDPLEEALEKLELAGEDALSELKRVAVSAHVRPTVIAKLDAALRVMAATELYGAGR